MSTKIKIAIIAIIALCLLAIAGFAIMNIVMPDGIGGNNDDGNAVVTDEYVENENKNDNSFDSGSSSGTYNETTDSIYNNENKASNSDNLDDFDWSNSEMHVVPSTETARLIESETAKLNIEQDKRIAESVFCSAMVWDTNKLRNGRNGLGETIRQIDIAMTNENTTDNLLAQRISDDWCAAMATYDGLRNEIIALRICQPYPAKVGSSYVPVVQIVARMYVNNGSPDPIGTYKAINIERRTYSVFLTPDQERVWKISLQNQEFLENDINHVLQSGTVLNPNMTEEEYKKAHPEIYGEVS